MELIPTEIGAILPALYSQEHAIRSLSSDSSTRAAGIRSTFWKVAVGQTAISCSLDSGSPLSGRTATSWGTLRSESLKAFVGRSD